MANFETSETVHMRMFAEDQPNASHSKINFEDRQLRYKQYADKYSDRFRSAIDFQFEEEPRQVFFGAILFLIILLTAFYDDIPRMLIVGGERSTLAGVEKSGDSRPADGLWNDAPNVCWYHSWCESFSEETFLRASTSVRRCLLALLASICIYTFLQSRDGLHVRPHPGLWRIVHGIGLFHLLIVTVLAVVPTDTARSLVGLVFPEILAARSASKDVFAGTLELDCAINASTIWRQIRTPWFISHVAGWLAKMCVFRNWMFCLVYSALFELLELSFQWLIPELRECWWDSILLDYFGANIIGMLLGALCLRLVKSHQYDWVGRTPIYHKAINKLLPFTWSRYEWKFFQTPRRLGHALLMLTISNMLELNVFFLIYALDIPAGHYINPIRCFNVVVLGCAAVAEHYHYVNNSGKRLGHNEWLVTIICFIECILCIKHGAQKSLDASPPVTVLLPWLASAVLFVIWCWVHFISSRRHICDISFVKSARESGEEKGEKKKDEREKATGEKETGKKRLSFRSGDKICELEDDRETPAESAELKSPLLRVIANTPPLLSFLPLLYLAKMYYF